MVTSIRDTKLVLRQALGDKPEPIYSLTSLTPANNTKRPNGILIRASLSDFLESVAIFLDSGIVFEDENVRYVMSNDYGGDRLQTITSLKVIMDNLEELHDNLEEAIGFWETVETNKETTNAVVA